MASIYFAGPYSPIMCGIATYTNSLTKECADQKWGVITFNLEKYGAPLRTVFPGRCFRYETVDASHENTFYQLEGLMVDKDEYSPPSTSLI